MGCMTVHDYSIQKLLLYWLLVVQTSSAEFILLFH